MSLSDRDPAGAFGNFSATTPLTNSPSTTAATVEPMRPYGDRKKQEFQNHSIGFSDNETSRIRSKEFDQTDPLSYAISSSSCRATAQIGE